MPGIEGEPGFILVPAEDVLYVAPRMILHAMIAHEYAPPSTFCTAVMECPAVSTDAYYAALGRFLDVLDLSREQLDRSTGAHRERVAAVRASRAARAPAKRGPRD